MEEELQDTKNVTIAKLFCKEERLGDSSGGTGCFCQSANLHAWDSAAAWVTYEERLCLRKCFSDPESYIQDPRYELPAWARGGCSVFVFCSELEDGEEIESEDCKELADSDIVWHGDFLMSQKSSCFTAA